MGKHYCKTPEETEVDQEPITNLEYKNSYSGYGWAVSECYERENGKLFVHNGEYSNQVNYCPFCAYEAKVKILPNQQKEKSVL